MKNKQMNLFDYKNKKNNGNDNKSFNLVEFSSFDGKEQPVTTSLQVAKAFGKPHNKIMRSIRKSIKDIHCIYKQNPTVQKWTVEPRFIMGTYINKQGHKQPMYYMNFNAFIYLVSGFNGRKAGYIRLMYQHEFDCMFNKLQSIRQQGLIPKSEANQRIIQVEQRDYKQLMECKSTFQKYENQDCHSIYYIAKYDYRKPFKWLHHKLIEYGVICKHRAFMRPCLNCDYMNEHYGKYGIHVTNKIVDACALNGGKSSNYRGRLFTYYCYYISEGKDKYSAIKKYKLYTNMGFTVAGRELIHKILAIHNVYPVSTHPKLPSIDVDLITKNHLNY